MFGQTTWKFYLTPQTAMRAMYESCERAGHMIDFEQYIFENNEQGRYFLEMLGQKAAAGVRVRLLLDFFGSHSLKGSRVLREAIHKGVTVRFFNPIRPWWVYHIFSWFLRTHRKLLIVDNATAFTGGVGIRMYTIERRDTQVCINGPIVSEFLDAFERMWEMAGAGKRLFRFSRSERQRDDFRLLTNSPHHRQRFTYWTLVHKFREAKKFIYVTTPYFIPDWRIFRTLKGAARRGVDVRLLVPNSPDWRLVRFGNSSFYARALRAGIRVFEFGPLFNHAKTYVVDGEWASVGSSNLDSLSLLLNYEADLASTNQQFVSEVREQFLVDLKSAKEIDRQVWRRRPFWHKLLELLVRPLHRVM